MYLYCSSLVSFTEVSAFYSILVLTHLLQVLDDPAGNSFLQGLLGETDPHLEVEHYTRSPEQDQVLMLGGEGSGVTDAGQQDNVSRLSECSDGIL